MKIDLHSHSIYSDGAHTIEELFSFAKAANLDYFSVTDHDDITSFDYSTDIFGVKHILGIELSTVYNGEGVHVLAYFKSKDSLTQEFHQMLEDIKRKRRVRMSAYIKELNRHHSLGLVEEELLNGEGTPTRGQLAKIISKTKNISGNEAFRLYLGHDNIAFVESEKIETVDCIKVLKTTKAFISIAHPCLIKKENLINLLNETTVDGLECLHPQNKEGDFEYFKSIAKEKKLVLTAGSDFHRFEDNKHADVGTCTIENNNAKEFLNKLYGT